MNSIGKAICLITYLLAAASLVVAFPPSIASTLQLVAVVLLAAHAVEAVVCFRHVKLYKGPIAVSLLLTLLFGLLHWKPLAAAEARKTAT